MASAVLSDILPPDILRLGFGCGGLLRGPNWKESLYLLETAIECGITYFDTARLYGSGRAESLLGRLAPRRRRQLIIATKVGILPGSRSIPLRAANRGVRLLHKAIPKLRDYLSPPAQSDTRFGVFDPPRLRNSVETSLRELNTDYLDILLLHECTEIDVRNDDLLFSLQNLQKQGKIRAFGLATGIEETTKIVQSLPDLGAIVQISNNIWNRNIERLPSRPTRLTITHSTLTGRFHELIRRIKSDDELAKQWMAHLQIDPRDQAGVAKMLLANALQLNPRGIVLFYSANPTNIRSNVGVARNASSYASQIVGLNTLIHSGGAILPLGGLHRDYLRVS
jgi:aryl-alcohol dehydrogenase-like predicted oxidoreductase